MISGKRLKEEEGATQLHMLAMFKFLARARKHGVVSTLDNYGLPDDENFAEAFQRKFMGTAEDGESLVEGKTTQKLLACR